MSQRLLPDAVTQLKDGIG